MKKIAKRGLSALLVLVMLVSLFSGLTISASAASYTYNTGTRHEVCTSLSSQAQAYYTGSYTYDALSALSGGTASSDANATNQSAMNSALFQQMQTLMKDTHTKTITYNSLTTYWPYTDASGGSAGTILFYSDQVSSSFNREHVWPKSRGSFLQTNAGSDLHHLRPTNANVNSTRGNMTMGNVRNVISGYSTYQYNGSDVLYYSTSADRVEINDNIKGDVARILLYVWCRWGEPNLFVNDASLGIGPGDDANNGQKVIESLDTLLQWCEMDPVDTWEMSRNDQAQNVQGNRNIFIDYPELAWQVLGQEVPTDMQTPSGEAMNSGTSYTITAVSSDTNWGTVSVSGKTITATPADGYYASGYQVTSGSATVTQNGNTFTVSASSDCTVKIIFSAKTAVTVSFSVPSGVTQTAMSGYSGDTITLPTPTGTPTGSYTYTFKGWVTSTVDNVTGKPATIYAAGTSFAPAADMTLYALYTYSVGGTGSSSTYNKITTEEELTDGASYVFASSLTGTAMSNTVSSNWVKTGGTYSGDSIEPANTDVWTVSGGVISCSGGNLYSSGEKKVSLSTSSTTWTFTVSGDAWTIASGSNVLSYNASGGWRPYSGGYGSDKSFYIYKGGSGGTTYYTTVIGAACAHTNTTTTTVDATCTAAGSVTETCNDCGAILSSTTLPMLSHNWVAGNIVAPTCNAQGYTVYTCSLCGNTQNNDYTDMIAHTAVTDAAVAATCTATGLTEGSHCSVCGTVITAQETIKALGHSWDAGTVTQEPTETQDGVKTYICTRCSETKAESIPALGSTYVVSFSVPDGVAAVDSISYNTNDASITLPTADAPDGYTFLGWSATTLDSVTDRPDVLNGAYTPTSSQTLYALYSYSVSDEGGAVAGSFTLVTSAPTDWSGEYVLTSADAAKVLLTDGTNPNTTAAAVTLADTGMTLSGNTLSGVSDKYILVVEKVGDYYSLRLKGSTDTKYLMTSNSNSGFNTATANTADTAQWTISLSSGAAVIANASYTSRTIRYNSSSAQFRTYTSGQSSVYLYAGSASTTYYTTVIGDACRHSNVTHTQAVAATCTAAGNIEYWYCADCGRYFTDAECTAAITLSSTVLAATGHDYSSETTTAATCTTDGVTTYTCANCGDSYTEAIPAPGHSWDEGKVTTEPTATVDGVMTYTCTVCGATRTEAIPALGEKVRYSRVTEIASGTEYIMVFCCDGTYYAIGTDLSPVAVTVENDVISLKKGEAPLWTLTATEAGNGYTIMNGGKYLSATSSSTTLSTGKSSCTWTAAQGTKTVCDANTFHIGVGTARAIGIYGTSTIKHYSLTNETNTGASYEFDIYLFANTCAHTNTELQGYVEATCTTNGYTGDVVCLDCGAVVTSGTTILQGHDYVEVSRVEATCTTAGSIDYACSRCDSTKTETVAALGHTPKTDAAVAATCTETGLTEGSHCSVCNEVLSAQTETPALGHDWVLAETTETYEHYTCSRCDATKDVYFRTVSFAVPDGVTAIESIATKDGETVTLPTPTGTPLANAKTYTFAGWVVGDVADTAVAPDFYETGSTYTVDGDVTFTALYYYTGEESTGDTGKFVLISDPSVLADGYELIIVSNGYTSNMALGCDYASSDTNFDGRTVTVTDNTITPDSTVQIFTVIDNGDGTVSLLSDLTDSEDNDYYLASASNTSNDIKIASYQGTMGDEAKWTISTFDDGTMKITSGNYERNTILFNSSNGGLFTCYGETYYGSDSQVSNIYGVRIFASNPVYHYTTELESECLHSNGFTYADNGDGTHTKTCADGCGYTGVEAHSEALDAENSTAPTCTETGTNHYVCSLCDAGRDETVPATGHSYEAVVTTPATCSSEGVMTYTCSVCGDSYTEAIPATDHTFGEDGACTTCGAYKYVKVTEAPANWEGEYLVVYAASDGAYVFDGKNDATGNYTVGTYYGEGTDTICVANPDAYQIIVEPNGTSYNIMNANADWFSYSSAKNGFSVGSTAADYSFVMAADSSVAITNAGGYSIKFNTSTKQFRFYGSSIYTTVFLYEKYGTCHHDWVLDEAASTSPTCTTSGQNVYKCSLCAETKTETVAALGHDYQYNTVDPTCTAEGYTELTCARCDYNEITNITDALGHDFSIEPDTTDEEHYIAPTATEDGLMYCQCSRCGEWDTEGVIIPALGVVTTTTYTKWTTEDFGGEYADTFKNVEQFVIVAESNGTYYAMTATEDGSNLKAVPVTLDGDTIAVASDSGIVPMIPDYAATDYNGTNTGLGFLDAEGNYLHLNSSNMNFNTSAQNGLFTVSKAYTNETFCLYVDATANYLAFDAENTCFTMTGSKSAEASMYIFVADNVTVTNNGVAVSALTLAADAEGTLGYILNLPLENQTAVWSCDNEDALVVDADTGAYLAGTSGTANVTVTVSTYASDGYSNYKEYTATIPVTVGEHTHSYTETVVAPTCETAGYTLHTCACGDSYKDNEIEALGHLWDEGTVTTEPTCVDVGVKTYHCSRCDGTKTEDIPALGHTPVEEILEEATCTQDGQKEIYCSVCDTHISFETIPATGHSLEAVEAVAPTCTDAGNEAYYTCTVCGLLFADAEGTTELSAIPTIPATGHSLELVAAVAATCTTDGNDAYYKCSVCGALFSDAEGTTALDAIPTVPATGHTEVTDAAVAPTCAATGLTEGSHCSVCGETIVAQTEVPATGHTEVTDAAVAPTCTETGLTEGSHCSVCGVTIVAQETVAALGHSYTYTDNGDGTHTAICSVCNDTVTADHTFVDGTCVCGAVEAPAGPTYAEDLVFYNKSLSLQECTAWSFTLTNTVMNKYDSVYVVVTRKDHTGTEEVDVVTTLTDHTATGTKYQTFMYKELWAKMLNDQISATIYAEKDGVSYYGETYTDSVANYALTKLPTATDKMKAVYANMLQYGAMAQIYYAYDVDHLANANLGEYASYVTSAAPTTENHDEVIATGGTSVTLKQKALGTANSVQLQYIMQLGTDVTLDGLYAEVSFTRANGTAVNYQIASSSWIAQSGYYAIIVNNLYGYDGRTAVSVTIKNANDEAVSATYIGSIETQVNSRQIANNNTTTKINNLNMQNALLNYYDACQANWAP